MSLIGATTNTSCGTIDTLRPHKTLEAQTYTLSCPDRIEPTIAVYLYDDKKFAGDGNKIIMNVQEVYIIIRQGKYDFFF